MQAVQIIILSVLGARALLEQEGDFVATLPAIEAEPFDARDVASFIQMEARLERVGVTESVSDAHSATSSAPSQGTAAQAAGCPGNATSGDHQCGDAHPMPKRKKSLGKAPPVLATNASAGNRSKRAAKPAPLGTTKAPNTSRSNSSKQVRQAKAPPAKAQHDAVNESSVPRVSLMASAHETKQLPDPRIGTLHDVVVIGLIIEGIDFNTLIAAEGMREVLVRELKEMGSARMVNNGVTMEYVDVELTPGSIIARVFIHPPEGVTAQELQKALEGSAATVRTDTVNRIHRVHGLEVLTTGPLSVSQVSVTVRPWVPRTSDDDTWVNAVFPKHDPGDNFADFVVFVIFLILVCLSCEVCGRCISGKGWRG